MFVSFSPSGCTFWGKKPWSRKKKLLWQLGTLAGAPLGIAVVAGVALPTLLVGLPLWAGRRAHRRLRRQAPAKRRAAVAAAVAAAVSTDVTLYCGGGGRGAAGVLTLHLLHMGGFLHLATLTLDN